MRLNRKKLFALHGWLGMNFGLLLALICLSGAFATLTQEIEWIAQPALRVEANGPVQWQETYKILQRAYPDMHVSGFSQRSPTALESLAWSVSLSKPDGGFQKARVDPYEAEVVRGGSRLYLQDFLRQLHYTFFSNLGFHIVCLAGLPLLLSVVSGLLFYKRWWRSLFRLKISNGLHAFFSSLHRLLGVWTLIFGLIIGVTGLWYLAEAYVVPYEVAYPPPPTVQAEAMAEHGSTPEPLPLDEYIAAAQKAFPELEPTGISFPSSTNGTIMVEGNTSRLLVRNRANAVFLDPYSAEVVNVRRSEDMSVLSWWVNAADSLHFGYWGGLASKLLWALFGLCLPVTILAGAYLSWQRAGVIGKKRSTSTTNVPIGHLPWWRRFPIRTWILIPLMLYLGWSIMQGYIDRQQKAPATTMISERAIGPWTVKVEREKTIYPGRATNYFFRFSAEGNSIPSFKKATLTIVHGGELKSEETELTGPPKMMSASLPTPEKVETIDHLVLKIEEWGGKIQSIRLSENLEKAPKKILKEEESKSRHTDLSIGPAAPWTFFTIVLGYALLSLTMVIGWFWMDQRH